jgi:hypothetical protein
MTNLSHIYTKLHETRDEFILRARRERELQTQVYDLHRELDRKAEELGRLSLICVLSVLLNFFLITLYFS